MGEICRSTGSGTPGIFKQVTLLPLNHNSGVLVTQLGARRHYAVANAFHSHGYLKKFCTDLLIRSESLRSLLHRTSALLGRDELRRLADRQSGVGLPECHIRTFPIFGLQYKWYANRARSAEERTGNWLWGGRRFAELCARELDDATSAVYAFTSAAKETFIAARDRGVHCWLDHATAPRAFEVGLIQEEARRFPGWSSRAVDDRMTEGYLLRQREELDLAHRIVCGSTFAKRAIEAEGVASDRVLVVPLGVAGHLYQEYREQVTRPDTALRVLYVGGDGLRKGIAYLNQALDLINDSRVEAQAAGDLELSMLARKDLQRRMKLLGPVPRSEMPELFRWADVLVLPSISDTFGMVILEAMAAGLVVVATENTAAPDILRDGTDGFVVPIRSPQAIAERLMMLMQDRRRLAAMGREARARAAEFTVPRYGERLIRALGLGVEFVASPKVPVDQNPVDR